MTALHRRGFLAGVVGGLGLLAAPAIVRSKIIMPISPQHTWSGNGILTPQMIANEAARILRRNLGLLDVPGYAKPNRATHQHYVDWSSRETDTTLSLQQFSERLIVPAAAHLAMVLEGREVVHEAPVINHDHMEIAATAECGGVGVRYVQYREVFSNQILGRLDVRST